MKYISIAALIALVGTVNAGGVRDIIAKQDKYNMFDKDQKDYIDGKVVKINDTSTTIIVQNTTDTSGGGSTPSDNSTTPSGNGTSGGNSTVPSIPADNSTVPSGNGTSNASDCSNQTFPSGGQSGSVDNYTYVDYYSWIDAFDWSSCGVPARKSCGSCGYGCESDQSCGHCYQSQCKRRPV